MIAKLGLQVTVWTGVIQLDTAMTPSEGWVNQIGLSQTPIPAGFPWNTNEPNDYSSPEDSSEDFAQLRADGTFDDRDDLELARTLCECTVSP